MDFTFTEDQLAVGQVARDVFARRATTDRLTELEATGIRHDPVLWQDLADADLLGLALPELVGGSGRGFLELGILLAEVGWSVAPVPVYATLVLGGDPIARYGTPEQHRRYLTDMLAGKRILTAGLTEPGRSDVTAPVTTARSDGAGWRLDGAKELVPAGQIADTLVISATTEDGGVGLFVVDAHAPGITVTPIETTGGQPYADITLADVPVAAEDRLGEADRGTAMLQEVHDRALVGLCAVQVGVTERALRIAASYTGQREQFGRPIGSFQAVQQRMADAFIDVEAIRWTTWHAAWLLGEGRSATREAMIAKFWAAEAGMRVAATAQQVHGGIGIDISYPLFRYFLWAKHNELAMGSATAQLARLGATYPTLVS